MKVRSCVTGVTSFVFVLSFLGCDQQDPSFVEDKSIKQNQSQDAMEAIPPEFPGQQPIATAGTPGSSEIDGDGDSGSDAGASDPGTDSGGDGGSAGADGGEDTADGGEDMADGGEDTADGGSDTSDGGEDTAGSDSTDGGMDTGDGMDSGGTDSSGTDATGGDGTDGGTDGTITYTPYTQTVTQEGPGMVDVLWVIDSSGSMSEEQNYLGTNFNSFITEVLAVGANFQTAVTSTDVCQETLPTELSERRCPVNYGGSAATRLRGSFVGDAGDKVLQADQADIIAKFSNYTNVGVSGSGFEHGLKAAQLAVAKSLSGENETLVRSEAFLAVIVVSDEEDDGIGLAKTDAYSGRNFTQEGLTTFSYSSDDLIAYLQGVKGAGKFSVSTITGTKEADGSLCTSAHSQPAEEGTQYIDAAQKTGGIIQSICESDWSESLAQIGVDLNAQLTQIVLQHTPVVDSIKVYVDNTLTSEWSYNSGNNAVKFNAGHVPAEGATIRIDYNGMP